ncbi:DNA topoisomerase III [Bacillus sp. B15-48]|uniref:DNA topoisomerase III n=1 Tax=Bacillus sp. B15-48 TaxID=1548601 RepID=UPI00193F216B|nr:DNA topoisomerase III [Bacillus sp. B15-48]MBM4762054.1 DNA topoisomerase III [Bacillus sp. B15-48]
MKLIIAEKPDQGRTLASVFKTKKRDGYIEILPNDIFSDGAYVTWAIGHLTELAAPEKYNSSWKKWSLETLPIIPSHFKYEVVKEKTKQFSLIQQLTNHPEVSEIIHAGDAGREGELIIRNILRLARCSKPIKRLWISSLTPKSIREGFRNLLHESDTKNLYFEAYTRACADWVVGMNASRLYTLLLQNHGFSDVFSLGRVQTPTLSLIVKREEEIEKFVSEPFWEVEASFNLNGKKYSGKWEKGGNSRIDTKELANRISSFCEGKQAEAINVKNEKKDFSPPLFYNLSAIQADANKKFKISPKKTLDLLQGLYQRGIISYPRSDSRYITEGEAEEFPGILAKIRAIQDYKEFFPLPIESIKNNQRYVNEKKVTDHYAIIPTEQVPDLNRLTADERKLYDLIVRSIIAAHFPAATAEYTTIRTLVDGKADFISKGKVQLEEGWYRVLPLREKEKVPELPKIVQGDKGLVSKTVVKESKTQPPKRYTEGQLITLMKTAGKHVEDKQLEKVLMKTQGLGTEATRAGIIMMLKNRAYIKINKNLVFATAKAKILMQALGEQVLASPEMTGKWEQRLKEIGEGTASPKQFMEQTNKLVAHLVEKTVAASNHWGFEPEIKDAFVPGKRQGRQRGDTSLGRCRFCEGSIVDKGSFYGCSNYQKTKCDFTISKKILGKTITQKNIKLLLKNGSTDFINGFASKNKEFAAKLLWDQQARKIKFEFAKQD